MISTAMLLRVLLLNLFLWTPSVSSSGIPILTNSVQCNSMLIVKDGHFAQLTPEIEFHWKFKSNHVLEAAVRYKGAGWVALGFSADGQMVGSHAFIGIPTSSGMGVPKMYELGGTQVEDVTESDFAYQVRGDVVQIGEMTTLLVETPDWRLGYDEEKHEALFLVAVGYDNTLGFHKYAHRFRINLDVCEKTNSTSSSGNTASENPASSEAYDHRAAFVAHGVFATLAFAVVIPAAVASALYRSLMPKMWIYIHVICNCLGFLFTVISVATAFGGMVMRSKANNIPLSHLDRAHHWVGLVLFLTICWQVFNGFQRPPVEPKPELKMDSDMDDGDYRTSCCGIQKPETTREKWHFFHRLSALCIVGLAIYQLQAGIQLFMLEYTNNSPKGALTAYWIWVAFLAIVFVYLHCTVRRRENRQSQMFRPGRNIMPQRDEEMTSMREHGFNVI